MTIDKTYFSEEDYLPSPQSIKEEIPLSAECKESINAHRKEIEAILSGKSNSLLLIVGPCSIHDESSVLEFAKRLKKLKNEVSDVFKIAMRVYFEKPRSLLGWKGLLYDPGLDGSHDIATGLRKTRSLLKKIAELDIPIAAEFLNGVTASYLSDFVSWGCIGARTSESQVHRELASSLPMPIAFKNSTDGNMQIAVNGAQVARAPHTFISISETGRVVRKKSSGNPFSHIVLRGSTTLGANYFPESVEKALNLLKEADLNESLLIDCSHGNSSKQHLGQITVFQSALSQVKQGRIEIKGLILESHLHEGRQDLPDSLNELKYGVSLTDPCLDYESAETLINQGYRFLKGDKPEFTSWNDCETSYQEPNLIYN
ncbi:3-deoxy-7-phosphoheptulonate synthase [Criblamydia sequanensis]|uniref:Phospho-2-dehydro-3-deoxyheptonate aldolase n=1 Tax=Candidatus Criblamydia sequanensis CRIB-18 TaxID=1437425 RepID=A0A090CYV6_9BACT|nr:3-deoxy-7-phosphoheptulonate synthase [Criblamydia sequanensis]CDR33957.1 Phospho-2-dehydro-3-deoxyheptonate aldolase [Criblamydia sequanensis CRIB-18]